MKIIRILLALFTLLISVTVVTFAVTAVKSGAAADQDIPQPLGSGGPDQFGYTFLDSNEPGGPAYAWEDISETGTLVTGWTSYDDGYAGSIPIGFPFNFYGNTYTDFYIGTNGYLTFGYGTGQIPWGSLPSLDTPNDDIALFGGDMYLENYEFTSKVYYQTLSDPTRLVVEFIDIHYCCSYNTPHTFEVILYPNGDILVQYQSLNGTSTEYVGIENIDGTDGLGYLFGLTDNLAIRYSFPVGVFLTPPDQSGFAEPGTSVTHTLLVQNMTGSIDSFDLSLESGGTWTTTLSITQTETLADGESQSFEVWVDIPASVSPGDSDLTTILAASVASPSVYTDTATLNSVATSGEVAYVTLSDSDQVALIDTTTHSVLGTVNVGEEGCDRPWRASMTPDGAYVYIACYYSNSVAVIETATNAVVAHITDIYNADGIAFTRDGTYALVGSRSYNQIMIVDTATYTIVNTIYTPGNPRSLAAHPYLNIVYVTSTSGEVLVIDATTFSILASIYVGGDPWDIATSPDGRWVFAGDRWGAGLHVIDAYSNTLNTTITGLGELTGLEVAPDGAYIYASHLWNGLHVIDAESFELYTTVSGIGTAWEAAVTCDGGELFIGNVSYQVPVIDTQDFYVSEWITLPGSGARGIAICPQYVASGVILAPHEQTNPGGHGQTVTHQEMLVNATGSTDSFALSLGEHAWDTSLSDNTIGPLADGESAVFTVSVSVPVDAPWYTTDTVVVTATSSNNPEQYFDTAAFTTQAYAPPQIDISPDSLSSTQFAGEVTTSTLNISNGDAVTLTFDIDVGTYPGNVTALHLDEPPGSTTFYDTSGYGNDATCSGNSCPQAGVPGAVGTALSFDGMDDYVQIPHSAEFDQIEDQDRLSFASWVWIDEWYWGELFLIINQYEVEYDTGWEIYLRPYRIDIVTGPGNNNSCYTSFNTHEWYHLAMSYDRSLEAIQYYVNGELICNNNFSGDILDTEDEPMYIGFNPSGEDEYSNGLIDELLIFNRALSPDEIAVIYQGGLGGAAPWLSVDPEEGSVPTSSSVPVQVTFDATGMQPGAYQTTLFVNSNDPLQPLVSVPVTMTVEPTPSMGWVEGFVTDSSTGNPLDATIIALGQPYTITTDSETGYYKLWLEEGSYILQASASGYVTATAPVTVIAGQGTTQDFSLTLDVPVIGVSPESMQVTQSVGELSTRVMTITNTGPAPLEFEIWAGGGNGTSFFAASTELYGYDVEDAWLRVVGTEDETTVQVIDLDSGQVIAENSNLNRYEMWDIYPDNGTFYKVEADKRVVGYESDFDAVGGTAFAPSLGLGPIGKEFIFYYHRGYYVAVYVFAVDDSIVSVYDTAGNLVASQTMQEGDYWDLYLSDAVYHVVSSGRIAIESVASNGYSTVPATDGTGVGNRFYFGTHGDYSGAFAVFAYEATDVEVYDLDSGDLIYSQHIEQGNYWWQTGMGTRRLRLESSGDVEVWAGDAEGWSGIEDLGDDISFAGGENGREYYLHSLMDGSVLFAPFDNTTIDVDGTVYHLNKDEYLHLDGCCYFRHIQSTRPILIQTLGRDSSWNDLGTYLGGVPAIGTDFPAWLGTDPVTGTVPEFSSMLVEVTFDATIAQPGTYTATLVILSNDLITPEVTVPVSMSVEPTADMGQVAGMVMDAWSGEPQAATVELVGVYTMTADPEFDIWAVEGTYDLLAYSPGYYTTTLQVTILAGEITEQDIELEPAQARLELSSEIITATVAQGYHGSQDLMLANLGPVPLEFTLHEISPTLAIQAIKPQDLNGKRILYDLYHGEPPSSEYSLLIGDLVSAGAHVVGNVMPIDEATLEGFDVLWVNCCGDTSWSTEELAAVADWLEEGGAVLIHGESSPATQELAEYLGINYQFGSCYWGTTTNIVEHPITIGVEAIYMDWACTQLSIGEDAQAVVYDGNEQIHAAAGEHEGGKFVVVAWYDFHDSFINNEDNRLMAFNTFSWLADPAYSDVPWMSEFPLSGEVPGHAEMDVTLHFDASDLEPGEYEAILAVEHNDPDRSSPVLVPVILSVVPPQAGVTLLPDSQSGSGAPGETVIYTLSLTNLGNIADTFTLEASGVWANSLSAGSSGTLQPGESFTFTLSVTIPEDAADGDTDATTVTVASAFDDTVVASAQAVTTAVLPSHTIYLPVINKH